MSWITNRIADVMVWLGYCAACEKPLGEKPDTALGRLCRPCFEKGCQQMESDRPVFVALLRAGVDRATANVMMIAKHEHDARSSADG